MDVIIYTLEFRSGNSNDVFFIIINMGGYYFYIMDDTEIPVLYYENMCVSNDIF